MKLLHRISLQLSWVLLICFAGWGTLFYYIIVDEINDETDDALEEYADFIIVRALTGEKLPENENGTNNSYHLIEVSEEYAAGNPSTLFMDEMVYLQSKKETEPARTFRTIFKNQEGRYFQLSVMIPTFEKEDLKETILYWLIFLYMLLLLTIILVNSFVQRYSLKPLHDMVSWIENLTLSKDTLPLKRDYGTYEFKILSEALWQSSRRNAEIYEQQSLFIGHTSHELQTPIAIAQNRLELLMDDAGLSEEQLTQLLKAKQSIENLSKLNKTLLLLTRIENAQFAQTSRIDINDLLASILVDFGEAYEYLQISCNIEHNSALILNMNETLATVLFSNLIKNAYTHNLPHGRIYLSVDSDRISISNTGASCALNSDYIFRRFYQGSHREGSTGLGLSLVESICKNYRMNVSYSYVNDLHRFQISFPVEMIVK